MVKNIQRRRVELKRHMLVEFDGFESRDVADVANGILLNIAAYITEWSAEDRLGASAIQNVTNVIAGNRDWCADSGRLC